MLDYSLDVSDVEAALVAGETIEEYDDEAVWCWEELDSGLSMSSFARKMRAAYPL